MLLKPRRRAIRKAMAVLAATTGIVWASVAPAHDDAKPTVNSPQPRFPRWLPPVADDVASKVCQHNVDSRSRETVANFDLYQEARSRAALLLIVRI